MMRRLAAALALGLAASLAACSGVERPAVSITRPESPSIIRPPKPLQCVPFARERSGIDIFGDAVTWWAQAAGRYWRGQRPVEGGVLVLRGYADRQRGHVAVVSRILGPRDILVDHANWLNRGEITLNVPVRDVSPNGDWSAVQVWHVPGGHWGGRTYQAEGFIAR